MGRRPYDGRSRREIRNQILAKQAYIRQEMIPKGWSIEAADFINRLIQRKPYKRLGKQGIHELKNHSWFEGYNWEALENKKITPPFIPNIKNVFEYLRNLTEDFTEADSSMENSIIARKNSFQMMFDGYDCLPRNDKKKLISKKKEKSEKYKTINSKNSINNEQSTKKTVKDELKSNLKELPKRLSIKKIKVESPKSETKKVLEEKVKKRISQRKESGIKSKEIMNRSVYSKGNIKKSFSKKKKSVSKNLNKDIFNSKQIAITLKKNDLLNSELTIDLKERKKITKKNLKEQKESKNLKNISWKRKSSKSKMGILGKPSSVINWEQMSGKSRNVRHVIKKRSALKRSLCKKPKKLNSIYSKAKNRANQSLNQKRSFNQSDRMDMTYISRSKKSKGKNDLKGYLSLNSKHFYESSKKKKEKKNDSLNKKNSKNYKIKNTRKLVLGNGNYV